MIDKEIEVNEKQYNVLREHFSGVIAHRKENHKYYIKIWYSKYEELILNFLKNDEHN